MPGTVLPVSTHVVATQPVAEAVNTSFEERWAAWQARGVAHDRATRRRTAIVAPILALAAAVVYALFVR